MVALVRKVAVKFGGWIEGGNIIVTETAYDTIASWASMAARSQNQKRSIITTSWCSRRPICGWRNRHQKAMMCGVARLATSAVMDDDYNSGG